MTAYDVPQETQPADEDLPGLQSAIFLAKEMGEGLGAGFLLV